ncbi:MAG: HAMP domain-containing histidine kinase [Clostridium sp.]|nr:HAMP domain-containing histidine kinase [Clostridium sp.]MCM1172224.1 HAMP domain-containing histidine kinase [Clostridium sp.]MCM1209900.1 HAMP domain-containing histidine kinase [Ruminococcus sp.]
MEENGYTGQETVVAWKKYGNVFVKKVTWLFAASFVLSFLAAGVVYVMTRTLAAAMVTLASGLALSCISIFIYRLCDDYISRIIADLSDLLDVLMNLQEKNVFAENEDTLLSKLQTKVIKLVRILKRQNERSIWEKENIKSLVSDISHQLKTPLANLKIYTGLLEEGALDDAGRKACMDTLNKTVDKLVFLSESIIKISRLEGGIINLNLSYASLNETVLMAVKDIYEKAARKNVELIYKDEAKISILHDRNWTREVVFNLLDNGVKYAKKGGCIKLTVREYGMFAAVLVEDENGAISEEEQAKIFTRFYRGKNGINEEGLGLGLYLAREITIKQGGYMNLKTTDRGNIFQLYISKSVEKNKKTDVDI